MPANPYTPIKPAKQDPTVGQPPPSMSGPPTLGGIKPPKPVRGTPLPGPNTANLPPGIGGTMSVGKAGLGGPRSTGPQQFGAMSNTGSGGGGGGAPKAQLGGAAGTPSGGGLTNQSINQWLQSQNPTTTSTPGSTGPAPPPLVNQANPDPRLTGQVDKTIGNIDIRQQQLLNQENQQDPNLQFQIDKYKERLGADTTQRAINRVGGALRGQTALAQKQANQQSALQGGDVGAHGAAIQSGAQNRLAKASADISLGRERDLDQLTLAGQSIMSAPGQMQFAKSNALNQFMLGGAGTALNAAQMPSQLALQQGQLGLQQYQAQNNAQNQNSQLALQQQQMQQQMAQQQMNQYMQMLQMMYS